MRFADPYAVRLTREPAESIIFAASQRIGDRDVQEDYFLNFNDECFVIADGVGGMPNGEVAAKLACETAIWAYKHIRQHRYYWLDKKLFMKRIFRSTNLAVWQKHREQGFEEGLATTLLVAMIGAKHYWVGNAGDSSAWLFHNGDLQHLTHDDVNDKGALTKALGLKRLGLVPSFITGPFDAGDVIILTTDGVANYLTEKDMAQAIGASGTTGETATGAVVALLDAAVANGSVDNMTAVLMKRIRRGT